MKITFMTFCLMASTLVSFAQTRFFLGPSINIFKSNLYNSSDSKADDRLNYKMTFGYAYGIELGFRFENNINASIEILNSKSGQNYTGSQKNSTSINGYNLSAKTNLNNFYIPVIIEYCTSSSKKIDLGYGAGVYYSYLTNYKDEYTKIYIDKPSASFHIKTENDTYNFNNVGSSFTATAKMDSYEYRRNNFGILARIGFDYHLTDRFEFLFRVNSSYSLSDIENKEKINIQPDANSQFIVGPYAPFSQIEFKYTTGTSSRLATHQFNLGTEFTIRYFLN